MKPKYIYICISIVGSSYSDSNKFHSFYMKFLYRNSFKDIFSSNQSCSYLILLQNIIQNVITKLHYIAYSNIVPQRIKYKVSTQAHTRTCI